MPKKSFRQSLWVVSSNQLMLEACVFLRNIIIARFLGAESLGEFIFLILTIRLFAMSTDLATERYILQVDSKHLKSTLAASHYLAQARGVILAVLLLLMGLNSVHGINFICYAFLAGSAFIRGFTHHGYRLKQRSLNFRPALYVEGSTMVIGTFAIYIMAATIPMLEVICACLLAQAGMHTALSHILSDERYQAYSNKVILKEFLKYGFPLLLTSVTMFWSMQGERVILSSIMPSDSFAHFSMLFQLALVPALLLGRIALSLGLPILARTKSDMDIFNRNMIAFQVTAYGLMIVYFFSFILLANPTLGILFGQDFRAEFLITLLVAVAQSLRLCRTPQSIAAQALGQTDIPLKANIVRVVASVFGAFVVLTGGSLSSLLLIACFGEATACVLQSLLFAHRNKPNTNQQQPNATYTGAKS